MGWASRSLHVRSDDPVCFGGEFGESAVLDEEIAFYDEHLPDWLQQHEGTVVLIKGRELLGFFEREGDAIEEGVSRFGLASFLVRRVLSTQPLVYIPVIAHGLLSTEFDLGFAIRQGLIDPRRYEEEDLRSPAC